MKQRMLDGAGTVTGRSDLTINSNDNVQPQPMAHPPEPSEAHGNPSASQQRRKYCKRRNDQPAMGITRPKKLNMINLYLMKNLGGNQLKLTI